MKKKLGTTLLISLAILSVGCNKSDVRTEIGIEYPLETITTVSSHKTIPSRDNALAEETNLTAGVFIVGQDIPEGRYVFTGDGIGTLSISEGEVVAINETIDSMTNEGVPTVTTDLYDGQKIEVLGVNNLNITPAQTLVRTSLSTGNWVVGLDIQPGNYICEPVMDSTEGSLKGRGTLIIYDGEMAVINEILDSTGEEGVKDLRVELKAGQTISIYNLPQVKFTEN